MKVKRHIVLYFVALPWNLLVAWPIVLWIRLLWGKDLRWETPPAYTKDGGGGGPCLTCQMKAGSFPVVPGIFPKGWYYRKKSNRPWGGTTLGHGIFYGPSGRDGLDDWTRVQKHEHYHVEQHEVSMLRSFIVGLLAGIVLLALGHPVAATATFLGIWTSGYLMMAVAGWLTALLRGEEAYYGSTHEESARAQTRLGE
jgi:hypothetical protein